MNFAKSFVITSLIVANLASTLMVPLIYLDFEVRNDYISKVLCIERNKPITVCGGSCYLTDKLNQAQEQQEKSERLTPREIVFFISESKQLLAEDTEWVMALNEIFLDGNESVPGSQYLSDIFRPPQVG